MKIYRCNVCGNIILKMKDSGVTPHCCGQEMELLQVQTSDGSLEKHVPVCSIGEKHVFVEVGSTLHPMEANHYIEWIVLETNDTIQIKYLYPDCCIPKVKFKISRYEKVLNVYAYCNVHGLYKANL